MSVSCEWWRYDRRKNEGEKNNEAFSLNVEMLFDVEEYGEDFFVLCLYKMKNFVDGSLNYLFYNVFDVNICCIFPIS